MLFRKAQVITLVIALNGCASIPPEAPELSSELGRRISAIEESNVVLLHRFFDQKRKAVDKFVEDEWVPEFADQFFSDTKMVTAWNTIVSENNKADRLRFITMAGPKLQKRINQKRLELIKPLDELERRIEASIRGEYTQVKAMNNSITSFLLSASKVAEARNRYLEMAGVQDEKIGQLIDKTDDAVSDLLGQAINVRDKAGRAEEFLNKVREIRDSI
ncbi:hypothetical protein [Thalassolituus pacificus]|uniref:Uncharacterized protein n=1 Tax=Thalassolituus pacificus TaxID=2975440 RepID=A0A9X2WG79_9GAMM|nr:hypothetical protein [Thalassolituus pacificus]MCT7359576.1 hypothetical protein [Thalassolituus pacificus]